jgi:hypothetical protein
MALSSGGADLLAILSPIWEGVLFGKIICSLMFSGPAEAGGFGSVRRKLVARPQNAPGEALESRVASRHD